MIKRLILATLFAFAICTSALAQETKRVLIEYAGDPAKVIAEIQRSGGKVVRVYDTIPFIAVEMPATTARTLEELPGVLSIEPDIEHQIDDAELDRGWGVKHIGSGIAHEMGHTGAGVKLGIIDTGLDHRQPEYAANYVAGIDMVNGDDDPMDDHDHGSHVTGSGAAVDNDQGVVGVAPQARLYICKAFNASGSGSTSNILACIDWLAGQGVQVINHSYGASQHTGAAAERMYAETAAQGIIHIASAGNRGAGDDTVGWPAQFDSTIAIAATDRNDRRGSFSSTGPAVELAAPGVSIRSTVRNGRLRTLNGTSMAAPHVTGLVALLIGAGQTDIRARLAATAVDLGEPGRDPEFGFGRIDVIAALGDVEPPDPPEPPEPPEDPVERDVHISDIDLVSDRRGYVNVVVTVVDEQGNVVADAVAAGEWRSGCETTGEGCKFARVRTRSLRPVLNAFVVTNVGGPGLTYVPELNTDPDGDSDGTTIMIPAQ